MAVPGLDFANGSAYDNGLNHFISEADLILSQMRFIKQIREQI
ncbi:hypothetical protein Pan110_48650 [Gimesia panareensis]|nr:hypothetical protein Pan110_48650 [Gimesia panareensis]